MTEKNWLACENPHYALTLLRAARTRSRRKERLAAVAGLRHFWTDLTPEHRKALAAAERYADGEIRLAELRTAAVPVGGGASSTLPGAIAEITHREASRALATATVLYLPVVVDGPVYTNPPFPANRAYAEQGRPMMTILRCVFGNPFCFATLAPAHRTPTIVSLARAAYNEIHLPRGELDQQRAFVLADALEELGANGELVAHLRGPGPHVRGCWAVDHCLGLT